MTISPQQQSTAPHWLADPVESGPAAGFGVYLHVPFCHHRCGYCDFATAAVGEQTPEDADALFDRYLDALVTDLGRQVAAGRRAHVPADVARRTDDTWPRVTSVFVGGGTPTLIGGARLARLLDAVRRELDVGDGAEITIECNPETASPELFAALAAAGTDRISMGAQSFTPTVLERLERGHSADRPIEAVAQAHAAGIGHVNLDLIYGTPGESDDDWRHTLGRVLTSGVDHVSAYALTIHDNTAFGRAVNRGTMADVDPDVQADRFELSREMLGVGGFQHYEVSNFALGDANRSAHNVLYWRHGDYLGVGVGAHAHQSGRRSWTTRSTTRYLDAVAAGDSPVTGHEDLDHAERALERLLLGLRLREGIHPGDLPPIAPIALEDALDTGLVETSCGRLRCTESGWFLLDEAVDRLTAG